MIIKVKVRKNEFYDFNINNQSNLSSLMVSTYSFHITKYHPMNLRSPLLASPDH